MEQYMLWIAIIGTIAFPFGGWVINTLITKKIDDQNARITALEAGREEDKEEFYKQLNGVRLSIESTYVRRDIYDQAMSFHQKETDTKFTNLIESMNKQFENVEKNIDGVKDLINEKFNGKKQ